MDTEACVRCSEPVLALLGDDGGDRLYDHEDGDGVVHWRCMTRDESSRHSDCCVRCGDDIWLDEREDEFGDPGRPGWLWPHDTPNKVYICPDCVTTDEQVEQSTTFAATVAVGQAIAHANGEEYPADLAELGEHHANTVAGYHRILRGESRLTDEIDRPDDAD